MAVESGGHTGGVTGLGKNKKARKGAHYPFEIEYVNWPSIGGIEVLWGH